MDAGKYNICDNHECIVHHSSSKDRLLDLRGRTTWFETYRRGAVGLYSVWGAIPKARQLGTEHRLAAELLQERETLPIVTVRGRPISRFTPMEGHIKEDRLSSDPFM
jgi:hypothetical protein